MNDKSIPWRCSQCGYNLHGIAQNSSCPECGSSERVLDLKQTYAASSIKYSCAFFSAACLIFMVSLTASAFGTHPAYFGLSSWWLLLGWLAGIVFYIVGISSLSSAQFGEFATQKIPTRFTTPLLIIGVGSVLALFKATYEGGWTLKPGILKFGLFTSPAIALSLTLLPALLGLHFRVVNRHDISKQLFITAASLLICASVVTGLYFLVWLDWTVGIDLYLSQAGGYANTITVALRITVVLGACVSLYGFIIGFKAYRAVK